MLDFAECNYKCLFKRKKKHHKAYYNASVVKNKNGHITMETPLPPPKPISPYLAIQTVLHCF